LNDFSDDILVVATQRNDKNAYGILVERHYRHVFALCFGVLGNLHDAEDITQQAFLTGLLKIRKLRDNKKFDQWILKITKNLCIDFLRRKKRIKLFAVEPQVLQQDKTNITCDLTQAIARLPMELRLPLVMKYLNNQNISDIAEKLNISNSGVWQRIRTARKQLHKLLEGQVHYE